MPLPGEIWLANIPFTNGAASKLRPVLTPEPAGRHGRGACFPPRRLARTFSMTEF